MNRYHVAPLFQATQVPAHRWGDYNIHEINAAKINKVEDMREQTDLARFHPVAGKTRVFMLDECHMLTTAAQNLLLKATEDAPKHVAWIFGTTDPGKLLTTLVRRCTPVTMAPLSEDTMLKLMIRVKKAAGADKPVKELASKLSELGVTSAGIAVQAAELYFAGATLEEAATGANSTLPGVNVIEVCRAFVKGDWNEMRAILEKATPEDARGLRLMLLSYLKSAVLKNNGSKMALECAHAIVSISEMPPPENPAFVAWFVAKLQLESRRFIRNS